MEHFDVFISTSWIAATTVSFVFDSSSSAHYTDHPRGTYKTVSVMKTDPQIIPSGIFFKLMLLLNGLCSCLPHSYKLCVLYISHICYTICNKDSLSRSLLWIFFTVLGFMVVNRNFRRRSNTARVRVYDCTVRYVKTFSFVSDVSS